MLKKLITIAMATVLMTANSFAQEVPVVGESTEQVKEQIALETMAYELEKAFIDQVITALEAAEANYEWVKSLPVPEGIVLDSGAEIVVIGGEAVASLAAVVYGGKVVTQEVFQKLVTKHPVLAQIIEADRAIAQQRAVLNNSRATEGAKKLASRKLSQYNVAKRSLVMAKPSALARVARGGVRAVPVAVAGLAAASAVVYVTTFNYGNLMTLVQTKSERQATLANLKEKSAELEALIAIGNN